MMQDTPGSHGDASESGVAPRPSERSDEGPTFATLPGRLPRFAAFLLDLSLPLMVVCALTAAGSWTLGFPLAGSPIGVFLVAVVVVVGAGVLSSLASWLSDGQSIGKALMGLEVRHASSRRWDGGLGALLWTFGRATVGYLVVDGLGMGAIGAAVGRHRRAVHDLVFVSQVVAVDPARFSDAATFAGLIKLRVKDFEGRRQQGLTRYEERYGYLITLVKWVNRVIKTTAAVFAAVLAWVFGSTVTASAASSGAAGSAGTTTVAPAAGSGLQVSLAVAGSVVAVGAAVGVGASTTPDPYGSLPTEGRIALFVADDGVEATPSGAVTAWVSVDGSVRLEPALGLPPPLLDVGTSSASMAVHFAVDTSALDEGTTPALVGPAVPETPAGAEDRTVLVVLYGSPPFGGYGLGWGNSDLAMDPNFPDCSDPAYCRSFVTGAMYYNCFGESIGISTGIGSIGTSCGGQTIEEFLVPETAGQFTDTPFVAASRLDGGTLTLFGNGEAQVVDAYGFDTANDLMWIGGWPADIWGLGWPEYEVHAGAVYNRALSDAEIEAASSELLRLAATPTQTPTE